MATVFYSWLHDLPNNTNRGFIEVALKKALENLTKDPDVQGSPREVDKDTSGIAGSPDIVNEILAKIREAEACVFDVSIVAHNEVRALPNPNVMIELGYALRHHPFQKIIMVFNTATGDPKELPFDLGFKRALTYHAPKGEGVDRSADRAELVGKLTGQLKLVFAYNAENRFSSAEVEFFAVLYNDARALLDLHAELQDRRLKPHSDVFRGHCKDIADSLRELANRDPAHARPDLLAQVTKVADGVDAIVGFQTFIGTANHNEYVATVGRAAVDATALLDAAKDAVRQRIAGRDYNPVKRQAARAALSDFERLKTAVGKKEATHLRSIRESMQSVGADLLRLAADLEVREDEDAKILRPAGHVLHVAAIVKSQTVGYAEVEALVARLDPVLKPLARFVG